MSRFLLLFLFLLAATRVPAHGPGQAPPSKSDTVFVRGLVRKPIDISVHDLQGLTTTTLEAPRLINIGGELRRTLAAAKGILLRDVLRKAEIEIPHKEHGRYYVVITATDSMQVLFAYNELMHGPAADGAYLLLLDAAGKDAADGPFTVLCTSDVATVPRYVKWVRSIEVKKI